MRSLFLSYHSDTAGWRASSPAVSASARRIEKKTIGTTSETEAEGNHGQPSNDEIFTAAASAVISKGPGAQATRTNLGKDQGKGQRGDHA